MTRSIGNLLLVCILLGISSGCKREHHYTPQHLKPLNAGTAEYTKTIDGVTVLIKKLSYKESASLFGEYISCFYPDGPTHKEHVQGIYPVHMSVNNASNYPWIVDASNISLPLLNKHELLEILYEKTPSIDREAIEFDITRKIIPYTSTLQKGETLSSLIFIKASDWDPSFTVRLERTDNTQEVVFHIDTKDNL